MKLNGKIGTWVWNSPREGGLGLVDPFHWRILRVAHIAPDPFQESFNDGARDVLFGTLLACQEFTNCCQHIFLLDTQYPDRLRDYLSRSPVELLTRWSEASLGRCDDGDVSVFDLVYAKCLNRWSPQGIGLEESRPWSHPENSYPLKNVWFGGLALLGAAPPEGG